MNPRYTLAKNDNSKDKATIICNAEITPYFTSTDESKLTEPKVCRRQIGRKNMIVVEMDMKQSVIPYTTAWLAENDSGYATPSTVSMSHILLTTIVISKTSNRQYSRY